ncbi:peptidoglycan/LPS O-acetylase OafA/YrhL [Subtercola boreus]|nr:peptidoglycan/LPS O-acetylase OafA/YrhL [Subtercola boreus]
MTIILAGEGVPPGLELTQKGDPPSGGDPNRGTPYWGVRTGPLPVSVAFGSTEPRGVSGEYGVRVIASLTGVRAFAAAWVVLFHLYELFTPLFPNVAPFVPLLNAGNLGVDFFFMLSGFIISYTYMDKLRKPAPGAVRSFLFLRFARIYPVHLFTVIVFVALVIGAAAVGLNLNTNGQYTPLNVVMNVLMLQSIPPAFALNNPAWSICAEAAAYLAFPLIARAIWRIRSRAVTVGLIVVVLAVGMITIPLVVNSAESWVYWAGYVLIWLRIIVGFLAGCLAYWLWRSLGALKQSPKFDLLVVVGVVGVVVAAYLAPQDTVIVFPAFALPFLLLILLGLAGGTGPISRFMAGRVPVWGGKISFSVYMTHFMLFTVAVKVIPIETLAAGSIVVRLAVLTGLLIGVVGLGAATYYIVEEPARRGLRAVRLPRRRSPRATPRRIARTHSPSSIAPAVPAHASTAPEVRTRHRAVR